MEKKIIKVPKQLVPSFGIGLIISVLSVITIHFFGTWQVNATTEAYAK